MKRSTILITAILIALVGCTKPGEKPAAPTGKLNVVTTIGMIADIAKEIGGDLVDVVGLMGPGIDPHLYKASEGDVRRLAGADLVLYNGLNLEGKMGDILIKMSRKRPVVPVTENMDPKMLREPPEFLGHYDPHIWFDVTLWIKAVETVKNALIEEIPNGKAAITKRSDAYTKKLQDLHNWVKSEIASIPKSERVLVTAHDAFGYFGRQYDIEVVGLQGISTATEAGVGDVNRIVTLILSKKVKAIFVESSVPRRTVEAVQAAVRSKGHELLIGGELFSDAMGAAGTEEGTYIGMVKHNVQTIVSALK